jgi:hypothetical protein
MPAAKRENSTHVRLNDEADAMLELLSEAGGVDKAKLAADLLHRVLLGEGHSLKVAAMRLARLGLTGMDRE